MRQLPNWLKVELDEAVSDGPDYDREFFMQVIRKHGPAKVIQRGIDRLVRDGDPNAEEVAEYRHEAEVYLAGLAGMC